MTTPDFSAEFNAQVSEHRCRMAAILTPAAEQRAKQHVEDDRRDELQELVDRAEYLETIAGQLATEANDAGLPKVAFSASQKRVPAAKLHSSLFNHATMARSREMGRRHDPSAIKPPQLKGKLVNGWVLTDPAVTPSPNSTLSYPNQHGLALTDDGRVLAFNITNISTKKKPRLEKLIEATLIGGGSNNDLSVAVVNMGGIDTPHLEGAITERFNFNGFVRAADQRPRSSETCAATNIEAVQSGLAALAAQIL